MGQWIKALKWFFAEHKDLAFPVVGLVVLCGACMVGSFYLLNHAFKMGTEGKDLFGQSLATDSVVLKRDVGAVLRTDFVSNSSESSPIYVGVGSGVNMPVGGGSSTTLYTKVFTDSGTFLLNGTHSINNGRKAVFVRRANKEEMLLIQEQTGVDTFKLERNK